MTAFDWEIWFQRWAALRLFLSPALLGCIAGTVCYLLLPPGWNVIVAAALASAGVFAGAVFGIRNYRSRQALDVLARVNASPDADRQPDEIC